MLQVTPKATRHLIQVRRKRGADPRAGARFVRRGGRVGLTFALAPATGDRVVDAKEIRVYVASEIADALDHAIIDARDDEDGKTALFMRRRAAASRARGAEQ